MKITNVSFSLSEQPKNLESWREKLLKEMENHFGSGTSIMLYPELFLMGLSHFMKESEIPHYVEKTLIPDIKATLKKDQLVVLGSFLRHHESQTFNSAPVIQKDSVFFQDKLYLTPWESDFTSGKELKVFSFMGLKTAVIICFDIEQPDLAMKLKQESIDLILVPSATTNKNGNDRVNRCASARAIELGAAVITSPIVGDSTCDLVDHNEGRQGFFLPAQDQIQRDQEEYSDYSTSLHIVKTYELEEEVIKDLKRPSSETKPFLKPISEDLKVVRI